VSERLRDLLNIGPTSEDRLVAVGIETPEHLDEIGAVEAYFRVKAAFPDTTLVLLYAIQGALLDIHWDKLPDSMVDELRSAVDDDVTGALGREIDTFY